MHPRISELLDYVEASTESLRAIYEAIPVERRTVRPSPDRWSPAEVVHHVAMVERRLAARLGALIEEARALPPETETTSVLSPRNSTRVLDRTNLRVASEAVEPRDTDAALVWDDYMDARQQFKQVVSSGDGLALGAVTASHPALGTFSGYDWIAFAGSHAARHAAQIREIASS